jgi:hypothetical protein
MGWGDIGDDVKEKGGHCNVVNENCKAPPMGFQTNTRAECFGCGLFVCTNPACSTRILWYGYGRKRICYHCKIDHAPQYKKIRRCRRKIMLTPHEALWLKTIFSRLSNTHSIIMSETPESKSILKKLKGIRTR